MEGCWDRTEMLLGREAIRKLSRSLIIIYGIGGVGSFVCEGLARSGVGHFVLVDHDEIAASNVNRQIHATLHTLGRKKTEVMKERITSINPNATVEVENDFVLRDNVEPSSIREILRKETTRESVTYVVDALDTITAKLAIAEWANRERIPLISAMGMGNKLDPTEIRVADVYETSVCPLCKVMRKELKKRGIPKLKVVYSKEVPRKPLAINREGEPMAAATETTHGRRAARETPGSVSFVPSVAGLVMAGEVVKDIVGVR